MAKKKKAVKKFTQKPKVESKLRETSVMVGCSGGELIFQDIENSGRILAIDEWDGEKVRKFFYEGNDN